MRKYMIAVAAIAILTFIAVNNWSPEAPANSSAEEPSMEAQATQLQHKVNFINTKSETIGSAILTQTDKGVHVAVRVTGLPPGEHGFHVHEKAMCEPPDFKSAGGHFNPRGMKHGFLDPQGPHAGDLPNLIADANGVAKAEFTTARLTLEDGARNSLFAGGGTALVIHAKADDYITDPAGDAGDRLACGVIKK